MENQIKPGDIVQLKSGGPHMTVTDTDDTTAWVTYFDPSTNELKPHYSFPLLTLSLSQ